MIYFTSDQHFFHENIIKYCKRPFIGAVNMNAEMIRKYNHIITDEDIVIHVGDISAGLRGRKKELSDIMKKLNGKKYLVKGNHDHLKEEDYLDMGFDGVSDYLEYGDYFINHYPLIPESKWVVDKELELNEVFKKSKCTKIIHGHSHTVDFGGHRYNVAVDLNHFLPVSFENIKDEMIDINARKEKVLF